MSVYLGPQLASDWHGFATNSPWNTVANGSVDSGSSTMIARLYSSLPAGSKNLKLVIAKWTTPHLYRRLC